MKTSNQLIFGLTIIALAIVTEVPAVGQNPPPPRPPQIITPEELALLKEAEKFDAEVEKLYQEGKYTAGISPARKALEIKANLLGKGNPEVAKTLSNLGVLFRALGKYKEAEAPLKQALAIQEKVFTKNDPQVALTLNNLAATYHDGGNYKEAEPLYQRALSIEEQTYGENDLVVALTLNNLAALYHDQGKYNEAEKLYTRSFEIRENELGEQHPDVATTVSNLASLYQDKKQYDQAEPLYKFVLSSDEKRLGKNHPQVALDLNNLARLYFEKGNYSQAEPLYNRGIAIQDGRNARQNTITATLLHNLADLSKAQQKYKQAENLYLNTISIREKVLGKNHPDLATSLNNLAQLYDLQGKEDKARPLYEQSLAIWQKVLGKNHPLVTNSVNNLARLYRAQDEIPRALEFQSLSNQVTEDNLSLIFATNSQEGKQAYQEALTDQTNATVSLHVQEAPKNPQATRLALTTVLRRKGRLIDTLAANSSAANTNQTSFQKLSNLRSQLAGLLFQNSDNLTPQQYQQQISNLRQQIQNLEAQFNNQGQSVTIDGLQKALPEKTALVEIIAYQPDNPRVQNLGKRFKAPRYIAYILPKNGEPKWVGLGDAATIDNLIVEFREALQNPELSLTQVKSISRKLEQKLMQPIRPLLGSTRKVFLSPDGQINLVPFAALVDEKNNYLVKDYEFTYLTSGRDILSWANSNPSKNEAILVGNPAFQQPRKPEAFLVKKTKQETGKSLPTYGENPPILFPSLPKTNQEIKAIAPLLPKAKQLMGADANQENLQAMQSPSILHLATHGFFINETAIASNAPRNPLLQAGIALAAANNQPEAILTATEIAQLNLKGTQLVVLSQTQTGEEDLANGKAVSALLRSLVLAGSETQLLSLWLGDGAEKQDLLQKYYQGLGKGQGRSEALRKVQLSLLEKHPYYWAAFLPFGQLSAVELESETEE
ncbi:MAG: tetratricopeptide repeat protein [Spirulinaceae cyanobacterium]